MLNTKLIKSTQDLSSEEDNYKMMEQIDRKNLGFGYHQTNCNVRVSYKNGLWGKIELHTDSNVNIHMAATCLHYGQEVFEGLKAYRCADGKVRIFRMEENAKRMINSAQRLLMKYPSVELFCEAVKTVVEKNVDFIPPYGTGASLYIRPLLIGTGAQVGVSTSDEYQLIIFVTPVGPYYSSESGMMNAALLREFDRAAPHGTGHVKVGGNYAASLYSQEVVHEKGYKGIIFLDPRELKYIDEFSGANFFGIKDNKYITPVSASVLPSITNLSLREIAKDLGMTVEQRDIPLEELSTFEEAGACGTAAVITPVEYIDDLDNGTRYSFGTSRGPWTTKLYNTLTSIQRGEIEDKYGWNCVLDI